MRKQDIEKVCMEVDFGKTREVEHTITHQYGRVVACHNGFFEVMTGNRQQTWAGINCEQA